MKRVIWTVVIHLVLIGLTGCTLDSVAARQEKASILLPELLATQTYGQDFVSTRNYLYRIDLGTATYARVNTAPVIFHLRSSSKATTDIATVTVPGSAVQNERSTSFIFSPLPDSLGKPFYFFIESPESTPGNAITLYSTEYDRYPDGSAYNNGKPVTCDLVFTAYSQEIYNASDVLEGFFVRVAQDKSFFICYSLLLVGVCAGLIQIWHRSV
jgi:hypothetical protein